jgi:hypothetical protein
VIANLTAAMVLNSSPLSRPMAGTLKVSYRPQVSTRNTEKDATEIRDTLMGGPNNRGRW